MTPNTEHESHFAAVDSTRDDFETWAKSLNYDMHRSNGGPAFIEGEYTSELTAGAWEAWQHLAIRLRAEVEKVRGYEVAPLEAKIAELQNTSSAENSEALVRKAIADVVAESRTVAHVSAMGYQADDAQRCLDAAQQKLELALAAVFAKTAGEKSVSRDTQEPSYREVLREIANVLWLARRDEEDRCDIELDELRDTHPVLKEARAVLTALSNREPIGYAKPEDLVSDGHGHVFRVYQSSVPFSATVPVYASLPAPPEDQEREC